MKKYIFKLMSSHIKKLADNNLRVGFCYTNMLSYASPFYQINAWSLFIIQYRI